MLLRVPLSARIFLLYGLFVGLSGYFILKFVSDQIKPGVRQSTEETLVDTANLLAELLHDEVRDGTLSQGRWATVLQNYERRRPLASIWGIEKIGVSHRVYVTDRNGIVLVDSMGKVVGQDYSHWNDVYRTLRGQYGARTTRDVAGDEFSTVMYVAAPIMDGRRIIGVVTVAKPNRSVQPYIDRSRRRLLWFGSILIAIGLAIGGGLSWWLSRATRRLTAYAQTVSAGQRADAPVELGGEFGHLASALESMRTQLEGKAYVERYVQTLTHELKSPLAAIRGAAELLRLDMAPAQRERFIGNIESESGRLQQLADRLLHLALVEQRQDLEERVPVPLHALFAELVEAQSARTTATGVQIVNAVPAHLTMRGERFLLRQAFANLLDNALDFSPSDGVVHIAATAAGSQVQVSVRNQGEAIPEFALPHLTERFYSLPRPGTGRKSTGLGLNFVQEVAELHGGSLVIRNTGDGVEALLRA